MNKKKKLLVALLSTTCIAASCFAFAACGGSKSTSKKEDTTDNRDQQIVAIYKQYVEAQTAANETVLDYDTWLAGIKGDPGDDGKSAYDLYLETVPTGKTPLSEDAWLASLKGNGIDKIEYNADNKCLDVYYTDSTDPVQVELPDELTHVHTYGSEEDYKVILAPTNTQAGFAYKTCTGTIGETPCDHIEAVVLPKLEYTVTVKLGDGSPAVGFEVTINGETETTNDKGVALLNKFGEKGDYAITVTDPNGKYVYFGDDLKTGNKSSFEVTVAKIPEGEGTYEQDPDTYKYIYHPYIIDEATIYKVIVPVEELGGEYYPVNAVLQLTAGSEAKTFKLSVLDDTSALKATMYGDEVSEYEVSVAAGETEYVFVSLNSKNGPWASDWNYVYSATEYLVKVETSPAPERGTVDNFPIKLGLGENKNTLSSTNTKYYATFDPTTFNTTATAFTFTFGSNVTLKYTMKDFDENFELVTIEVEVTSGEKISLSSATNFVISSTDGNADIKIEEYFTPGAYNNPYEISGLNVKQVNSGTYNVWFKYQATASGKYTVVSDSSEGSLMVYEDPNTSTPYYNWTKLASTESKILVIDMKEGSTYYFRVSCEDGVAFVLREYNAATDNGFSEDMPMALSNGSVTLDSIAQAMYFTYTTDKTGVVTISVTDESGNDLTYNYYGSPASIATTFYGTVVGNETSSSLTSNGVSSYSIYMKENSVLSLQVSLSYYCTATSYKVTVSFAEAVEHEVTVSGVDELEGLWVTVYDAEGNTLTSGTTDAQGKVTLLFPAGVYTLKVSGYSSSSYYAEPVTTTAETTSVALVIKAKMEYTVTVKNPDNEVVSGVTVMFKDNDGNIVTYAQTGEDGVATLKAINSTYTVVLSGVSSDYYAVNVQITGDSPTLTITLITKTTYTVTVVNSDNEVVSGVTVSLKDASGTVVATATTNESGVATLKAKPDAYTVAVSGSVVGEGTIALNETTATITAEAPKGNYLVAGEGYLLTNFADAITYTIPTDGTYTIVGYASTNLMINGELQSVASYYIVNLKAGDTVKIYTTSAETSTFEVDVR